MAEMNSQAKSRFIGAALVIATIIMGGSLLSAGGLEGVARIWLTTAVYMLGPLLAAMIVMPLTKAYRWLFGTAVILALMIIFPWAFINPGQWAATQMSELGRSANILFFMLLTLLTTGEERPLCGRAWVVSGFYILVMLVLGFLV